MVSGEVSKVVRVARGGSGRLEGALTMQVRAGE